ncbi:LacI family DNA-binding transcriptional regulator [Treponema sp.]
MGAIILARSNSRIIGVIIFQEPRRDETVLEDPFSSTILGALEHEIRQSGYFMMLHTTSDENDVLRLAKTWKLDGLIILWVPGEICRIIEQSVETPVVFVDCYFDDDGQTYHNVGLDDKRGGYEMCRYLLSKGHRKILFLANDKGFPGGDQARFEGCQEAYKELNLNFEDECFIPLSKDHHTRESLYRELCARPLPYTALFFSADYYAAEAVSFFQEQGIDIPRELSVVGFDDNIFSRLIRPHLTTVHQDVYQKGQSTVAMLMQLIRGETIEMTNIQLPVRLELRQSVQKLIL